MQQVKAKLNTVLAALLAVVLAFSMVPSIAFAGSTGNEKSAEQLSSSITVTGLSEGDVVAAYKVITIGVKADNTLNYEFNSALPTSPINYQSIDAYGVDSDGYVWTKDSKTNTKAQMLTADIAAALTESDPDYKSPEVQSGSTQATLSGLPAGLYFVRVYSTNDTKTSGDATVFENMLVDISPQVGTDGTYTSHGSVTATVKAVTTNITKKVETAKKSGEWADKADTYSIGETAQFKISVSATPKFPETSDGKTTTFATWEITDPAVTGLAFNEDEMSQWTVKVGEEEVDPSADTYSIGVNTDDNGAKTLYVKFENTKFNLEHQGVPVEVIYTATVTGDITNNKSCTAENTAKLTVHPNPYTSSTTDKESKATVNNYGFYFQKVSSDTPAQPLAGATFELQKKVGNQWKTLVAGTDYKGVMKSGSDGYIYAYGLGAGDYQVVETSAPAGYQAVDSIKFTISANNCKGDNPAITGTEDYYMSIKSDGAADGTVVDQKVQPLPVTGAAGTLVLTLAGIALIAGAVVLITRNRKEF